MYKGTKNYLPKEAKGFNPINWLNQIKEVFEMYPDKIFYWTDSQINIDRLCRWDSNINMITKEELCEKLKIK